VYHDICSGKDVSSKEFTRRLGEVVFQEGAMLLQLRVHVRCFYLACNAASNGLDEERYWRILDVCGITVRVVKLLLRLTTYS
jgi:hypothetical protein